MESQAGSRIDRPLGSASATRSTAEALEIERKLVAAAQADSRRFAALYDRHFERVYAFAISRLRDRSEAEDVTAETFHRALRSLPRFEWRGVPYSAWLLRIAANAITDHRRRNHRLEPVAEPPEPAADPEDDLAREVEQRARVHALVRELPTDQRQVIALRFSQDHSIQETAAVMNRTPGAIKQLQLRAVRNLRRWAEESDG